MTYRMTYHERIEAWVRREFNAKYVDRVVSDLVDVASGTRPGNRFEVEALDVIFPEFANSEVRDGLQ